MIEISNKSAQEVAATTGHKVPAGGTLKVSNEVWDRMLTEPYIAGQVKRGKLVAELAKTKNKPAQKMTEELAKQ